MALTGPVPATFGHDGAAEPEDSAGTTAEFLYDGLNPVQEVQGATVVDPLTGLRRIPSSRRRRRTASVLADALGSTVALSDADATIQTEYTYEPFGATAASGASSGNAFQYTERENDGTGLYYYRARYYHPQLQRFLSEDPLRLLGGDPNLYAYVFNDPVISADPLGLQATWLAKLLQIAAVLLGFGLNPGTPPPLPSQPGIEQPQPGVDTQNVPRPGPPRQPGPNPLQNPQNPTLPTAPPGTGTPKLPVTGFRPAPRPLPGVGPAITGIGTEIAILLIPAPANEGEDAWCAANPQSCGKQGSKSNR